MEGPDRCVPVKCFHCGQILAVTYFEVESLKKLAGTSTTPIRNDRVLALCRHCHKKFPLQLPLFPTPGSEQWRVLKEVRENTHRITLYTTIAR
jgi:DNA-directed RNA polymerase subunit N (RpoN/RPB10)